MSHGYSGAVTFALPALMMIASGSIHAVVNRLVVAGRLP